MKLKSGISKEIRKPFIVDENALIRIANVLDKYAKELSFPTKLLYRVVREDHRFYEVEKLEEALSDPNTNGKRVISLSIELVGDPEPTDTQPADWIVKISYILESSDQPYAVEGNGIHIRLQTKIKTGLYY